MPLARSINHRGGGRVPHDGVSVYQPSDGCLALALTVIRVLIELVVGPPTRYLSCTLLYITQPSTRPSLLASRRPSLIEREPFDARFRNFQPIKKKIDVACPPPLSPVPSALTHRCTYPVIRLSEHVSGHDSQRTVARVIAAREEIPMR